VAQLQQELTVPRLRLAPAAAEAPAGSVRERYRQVAWFLVATDAMSLLTALVVAYFIRFGNVPVPIEFGLVMALAPPLWVGIFHAFGLYAPEHLSGAEEFRRSVAAAGVGVTAIVTVSFWSHEAFSRIWVGLTWVLATGLVLTTRASYRRTLARLRREGSLTYRTLIVGLNQEGTALAEQLSSRELGYNPVGALMTGREPAAALAEADVPVIGHVAGIDDAIRDSGAECVFVASTALSAPDMARVTKAARRAEVELRVSSNLPEVLSTRLTMQPVGSVMAMALRPVRLSGAQATLKRGFDLLLSSLGLLTGLPLWIGIAMAIRLTSRGPVFFRQTRVGKRGRTFTLLKFRTMVNGAEGLLEELRPQNEADGPLFKLKTDPRVTPVGGWLRRCSLDEFPQLLNVLAGHMSLVGPRPALAHEVARYEDWHHGRREVRPGITGLWQINGRSDVSFDDHVRRDLFYIENWSLSYDLFILAKTIPAILSRRGAY
jgi:exopolysaccharide biosynthesis polyprenyl glycosylphosphotransferase